MNINWFKNNYILFCSFNANVFVFAHFDSYNFCIFSLVNILSFINIQYIVLIAENIELLINLTFKHI